MIGNIVGMPTLIRGRIYTGEGVGLDRMIEGIAIYLLRGVEEVVAVACLSRMFRRIQIIISILARTQFTTRPIMANIVTKIFIMRAPLTTTLKVISMRIEVAVVALVVLVVAADSLASRKSQTWAPATPQLNTEVETSNLLIKEATISITDRITPTTTTTPTEKIHLKDRYFKRLILLVATISTMGHPGVKERKVVAAAASKTTILAVPMVAPLIPSRDRITRVTVEVSVSTPTSVAMVVVAAEWTEVAFKAIIKIGVAIVDAEEVEEGSEIMRIEVV